jgi:uncharacterized membrane-anchored protein YhcB (DUF1043 family)
MAVPRNQVAISGFVDPYAKLSGTFKDLSSMYADKASRDQKAKADSLDRIEESNRFNAQQRIRNAEESRRANLDTERNAVNKFYSTIANNPDIYNEKYNELAIKHLGATPEQLKNEEYGPQIRKIISNNLMSGEAAQEVQKSLFNRLEGKGSAVYDPNRALNPFTFVKERQALEAAATQSAIDNFFKAEGMRIDAAGGGRRGSGRKGTGTFDVVEEARNFDTDWGLGGLRDTQAEKARQGFLDVEDALIAQGVAPAERAFVLNDMQTRSTVGPELRHFDNKDPEEQAEMINNARARYTGSAGGVSRSVLNDIASGDRYAALVKRLSANDSTKQSIAKAVNAYEALMEKMNPPKPSESKVQGTVKDNVAQLIGSPTYEQPPETAVVNTPPAAPQASNATSTRARALRLNNMLARRNAQEKIVEDTTRTLSRLVGRNRGANGGALNRRITEAREEMDRIDAYLSRAMRD